MLKRNRFIQKVIILFGLLFFLPVFAEKSPVPYSRIEPILFSTWEKTYPVMYTKILKKDLIGKGIIMLREKKNFVYLYTFLVAFPKLTIEDSNLKIEQREFKTLEVKLYYDPSKEEPYWIDLGEITEYYDKSKVVRYIK